MAELKRALGVVGVVVLVAFSMILGEFLGDRIGRWRLAQILGILTLTVIVAFAIYATIVLIWWST